VYSVNITYCHFIYLQTDPKLTREWPHLRGVRFSRLAHGHGRSAEAHKILAFDEEACLQQAYEAMLKASLGFMFSHGFRARSQPGHDIAIIDFVRTRLDKKHAGLISVFDRLRRKRNLALYDDRGFVSQHDAKQALQAASDYLNIVRADIIARKP
jgi:hypothetical protein